MIVLGLDTTGAHCSACLVKDDQVLAHISEKIGRGHAERLAPMVAELFSETNVSAAQVDRLAVCTGPGSFTGLRVALSFAKGFALPRHVPIVGLNALAVTYLMNASVDQSCLVYQDVKRGQIMVQTFAPDAPLPKLIPELGTIEAMTAKASLSDVSVLEADYVDVTVMARTAITLDPSDYPADPLYARPPDAKPPGGLSTQPA